MSQFAAAPSRPPSNTLDAGRKPSGVSIRAVTHSFGAVRALDRVSLEVAPRETLCLLGHSGCGKSTLLRILAGLQEPDEGSVAIGGREVCGPGVFVEPEQRGIGFMVQDYALFPHLSVIENVSFGLPRRRSAEARAVARAALGRVGLVDLADRYPHMLSGGEQQRVALARALAPGPLLLLLDEPFSNLDRRTAFQVRRDTMAVLSDAGTTTMVVTHDPHEAMELADRIVLMEAGRIIQAGRPEDLYRAPVSLFAARFFGELNEWSGPCEDGHVMTPFGTFEADHCIKGNRARICFRPSAVRLVRQGMAARVVGRMFLGDAVLLSLATESGLRVDALVAPEDAAAVTGEVSVAVDPQAVFLFAEG